MQKKKGFTLIELLAVVVVLTLLLVIAVPKILDVIEKSEKLAYEDSVNLMVKAAKLQYQRSQTTDEKITLPATFEYEIEEGETRQTEESINLYTLLKFTGDKPQAGKITLTETGKVIVEELVSKNGKWCAVKEEGKKNVTVGKTKEMGCTIEGEETIVLDKTPCELEVDKDNSNILYIDSASDLYKFSQIVNGDGETADNFQGKTIVLRNNIDMSQATGTCIKEFEPIGMEDAKKFKGTFDGGAKTISNLTINKSNKNYVGLFGYLGGTIKGLVLKNFNITGKEKAASLVGSMQSGSIVNEIIVDGSQVTSKDPRGVIGYKPYGTVSNIVVRNVTLNGSGGYLSGDTSNSTIVESGEVIGTLQHIVYTGGRSETCFDTRQHSNAVKVNGENVTTGYDPKYNNDINLYELTGLDTYIGGDNDSSGYYFDYDKNGIITLKKAGSELQKELTKDGEYYLINNENDWKIASLRPSAKYRLTNNLNFTGKKYYMLGSQYNYFSGILDGNTKTISNINIEGHKANQVGIIGYINDGTVEGLNIENIYVSGGKKVGLFGNLKNGNIVGLNIKGITAKGNENVGGLVGHMGEYRYSPKVNEIVLENVNVSGAGYVDAVVGYSPYGTISNIVVRNPKITELSGNSYGGFTISSGSEQVIVESGEVNTNGTIFGSDYSTTCTNVKQHSNLVKINGENVTTGYDPKYNNDINLYELTGLDTYIGGDNDSSGFYFDYDNNGKIVVKKVGNELNQELTKNGEYYLINNENDWKIASLRPSGKYKLMNDLNFSGKKYYMLGSQYNKFSGILDGNAKTISNIDISGNRAEKVGLIGQLAGGTIVGLNIKDINVKGYSPVGGLVGEANGTVKEVMAENVTVTADRSYAGTVIGLTEVGNYNNILVRNSSVTSTYSSGEVGGALGFRNYGTVEKVIVESANLTSPNASGIYPLGHYVSSSNNYYSNNVKKNGVNVTDGFATSNIGNIGFYTNKVETVYNGDANNTGYFFDYVDSKSGVYVVKAYSLQGSSGGSGSSGGTGGSGGSANQCSLYPCTCNCNCDCEQQNALFACRSACGIE